MAYADLGKMVKQKYPGAYDSVSDEDLGKKTAEKYPQYQSVVSQNTAPAAPPKTFGQKVAAAPAAIASFLGINKIPERITQGLSAGNAIQTTNDINASKQEQSAQIVNRIKQYKATGDTKKLGKFQKLLADLNGTQSPSAEELTTGGGKLVTDKEVIGSAGNLAALAAAGFNPSKFLGRVGFNAAIGGVSGASNALKDGKSGGDLVKSTLQSAALGGVVPAAVEGATLGFNKAAGALGNAGKNIALKNLRPSPSQVTKFSEKTGKDLADFVIENKLFDKGTGEVEKLIKPVQESFDKIATESGKSVSKKEIIDSFDKEISKLKDSTDISDISKAKKLEQVKKLVKSKFKSAEDINVADLTLERKKIDANSRPTDFMSKPNTASARKIQRDIYQGSVQKATEGIKGEGGKNIKDLGLSLRDLYAFKDIAKKQQNLGKGSLAYGLLQTGGGAAGAVTGFQTGDNFGDKLKNAAIGGVSGALVPSVLNNPKLISTVAKGLIKTGGRKITPQQAALLERLIASQVGR